MNPLSHAISMGDKYGPAMEATTPEQAQAIFERLVGHAMSWGKTRAEAEAIERTNLGYYAGYYDSETRARVERLFQCEHPIFGAIAENGAPGVEQAFAAGMLAAQRAFSSRRIFEAN